MTTSVSNASGATCTTPGLLQTEDYIDALLGDWLSGEDRRHMILPRMGHQHLLDTDREFVLVMSESALRWNMGGTQ